MNFENKLHRIRKVVLNFSPRLKRGELEEQVGAWRDMGTWGDREHRGKYERTRGTEETRGDRRKKKHGFTERGVARENSRQLENSKTGDLSYTRETLETTRDNMKQNKIC